MTNDIVTSKDSIIKDKAYWQSKHPIQETMYRKRPCPGSPSLIEMDVRRYLFHDDIVLQGFLWPEHCNLPVNKTDEGAHYCQKIVCGTLKYVGDQPQFNFPDFWLLPTETLTLKTGDCEDGAFLMASLILNSINPSEHWRVRVAAGDVVTDNGGLGGHAYVMYCRMKDNEWVILDWCYYSDPNVDIDAKPLAKDVQRYKEVWFSVDRDHAYSHKTLDLCGRISRERRMLK